ncbi:hypothetical protein GGI23_003931 [Coemansia sp. RSA 2559]|nr:hypothetical protein GGI23_003931 [Coemansia sp. RSA 2559]
MHSPPRQQAAPAFGLDVARTTGAPAYSHSSGITSASRGIAGPSDNTANQERLNALRERILGTRASNTSSRDAPQPQQPSAAPGPSSATARLPPRLAGPSDTVPNMEDIRQKIALMRNSLRSQK